MGEDFGFADGVGVAGEDDEAFVEDIGGDYDVEHALDFVLHDYEGSLDPFADLGEYHKRLSNHPYTHVRSSRCRAC